MDRFVEYVSAGPEKRAYVTKFVLFGDKMDVKICNAGKPNAGEIHSGTIRYELKRSSQAVPGYYQHGFVKLKPDRYSKNRYLHLIHHEATDGSKIGKFLCSVGGAETCVSNPNVYNRYDWCHYRNWGDKGSDTEDQEGSGEEVSEEEDLDESREESTDEDFDERKRMFFVSVEECTNGKNLKSKYNEVDRLELSTDCIEADWHYGLKITDPKCGLAFAYVFGDALVNDILSGAVEVEGQTDEDEDYEEKKETVKLNRESTFDEEMDKFLIEGFSDRINKSINPILTRISHQTSSRKKH